MPNNTFTNAVPTKPDTDTQTGGVSSRPAGPFEFPPLASQAELDRERRRERAVFWAVRIAEGVAVAVLAFAVLALPGLA